MGLGPDRRAALAPLAPMPSEGRLWFMRGLRRKPRIVLPDLLTSNGALYLDIYTCNASH